NQLTGPGPVYKTGPGWFTINNGQNSTGTWTIAGGVIEMNSATGLGNAPLVNVTGDGSSNPSTNGEFVAANGRTLAYNINLAGGILSGDNPGTNIFTGPINVTAASSIRLGDFFGATIRNLNISGNISGSGNLRVIGPLGSTPAQGQNLNLSGNNS